MSKLRAWLLRWKGLFRRERGEQEFAAELETHLQFHIEENLRRGLPPEEARRQALIKLGGVEQTKELYRERHRLRIVETLWQDVRFGVRMLRKSPGFTTVAVLTLALGIGANTAIFSVVNAVLLRGLPFKDTERLVVVYAKTPTVPRNWVSYPELLDWRSQSRQFDALAGWTSQSVNLTGEDEPTRVVGSFVTANFFPMLGIEPVLGRSFRAGEDEPGAPKSVLLSEGLWKSRYGADAKFLGRGMILNGDLHTVIGVMPDTFANTWFGTDIYLPLPSYPNFTQNRGQPVAGIFGRLNAGVRVEQAQAEMDTIATALARQYPDTHRDRGVTIIPLHKMFVEDVRQTVLVLFGAVGFVMLIACANVANLLLSRLASREREMATRAALGANRTRLVRQMLTETLLLWTAGGALGLWIGRWGIDALLALSPAQTVPTGIPVQLDTYVLAFTIGVSVLTGICFGLLPALRYSRPNVSEALKEGSRTLAQGPGRLRGLLVVSQVGLALVVLIGSGLLVRSFLQMQRENPGFDGRHLLTLEYRVPRNKYPQPQQQWDFHRTVVERVRALPGVRSAAVIFALPMSGNGGSVAFELPDREPPPPEKEWRAQVNRLHPDTLATLRIPVLRGRGITEQDTPDTPRVALVNQRMATQYWPSEDPIGKQIKIRPDGPVVTVVGVVGNVKQYSLDDPQQPQIWGSFAQLPHIFATLAVRTEGDPMSQADAVRAAVWSVDKDQPVWKVRSMEFLLDRSLGPRRFLSTLMAVYSALALVLAAVGIYGVISYGVAQRTHEIGIRVALGARPADVRRLVLGGGLRLALIGVGLGLAGALALTRLMSTLLFGVSPHDPFTFATVAVVLLGVAIVASLIPAWRATRVDPMVALRFE